MKRNGEFEHARRAAFYGPIVERYRAPLRLRILRKLLWLFLPFVIAVAVVELVLG